MDEQIVVVSRDQLFQNEKYSFQGVLTNAEMVDLIFSHLGCHYTIMRRGDAESNPHFKQPIPYVMIRRGNEIFTYKRLGAGGEEKLHNLLSIGAGGHMNASATGLPFTRLVLDNLDRELSEELILSHTPQSLNILGLINDDENEVGKVHIGVLAILDFPIEGEVLVRETDVLEGSWKTLQDLYEPNIFNALEPWSKIAVQSLNKQKKQ